MTGFSLLMSVYAKESPAFLAQCLDSISALTVMPNELVIVKDGPLTEELEAVLGNYVRAGSIVTPSQQAGNDVSIAPPPVNIISLPENVTQGPARAEGVLAAKYDWVAIMDSDDVCRADRFEKQLKMIDDDPELGLIGGQIAEFIEEPGQTIATRAVPQNHAEIVKFAKKRNPFNSMTVMFKRDIALQAGNYRHFPWFEDYDLWVRMIKNGAVCANHPGVLADARIGGGMYGRRRGTSYINSEWRMQKQLKELGMINTAAYLRNIATRIPLRLLPERALKAAYRRFARI